MNIIHYIHKIKEEKKLDKKRLQLAQIILTTYSNKKNKGIEKKIIKEDLKPYLEEWKSLKMGNNYKINPSKSNRFYNFLILFAIIGMAPFIVIFFSKIIYNLFNNHFFNTIIYSILWLVSLSTLFLLINEYKKERTKWR